MKKWLLSRVREYETTIGGIVLGGLAGAGYSIQQGQVSKEAIAIGAGIGAAGALSKTPTWARVFKGATNANYPTLDEINRRVGGGPEKEQDGGADGQPPR